MYVRGSGGCGGLGSIPETIGSPPAAAIPAYRKLKAYRGSMRRVGQRGKTPQFIPAYRTARRAVVPRRGYNPLSNVGDAAEYGTGFVGGVLTGVLATLIVSYAFGRK
jgi:hypothetical protein